MVFKNKVIHAYAFLNKNIRGQNPSKNNERKNTNKSKDFNCRPTDVLFGKELRWAKAVRTRLELATPCVTGTYSNQLNYRTFKILYLDGVTLFQRNEFIRQKNSLSFRQLFFLIVDFAIPPAFAVLSL